MRATATGDGGVGVDVVVCSQREDAGLAAAPVALRRLSGLVAKRRDLAAFAEPRRADALVAAARRLLRGGGAVAPVGRAPAATVSVRPAIEPIAPRGARRRRSRARSTPSSRHRRLPRPRPRRRRKSTRPASRRLRPWASRGSVPSPRCSSHAELNLIRNSFYALGGRTVFSGRPSAVKKKRKKLIQVV